MAPQPRFRVQVCFNIYWSKSKNSFYAYVDERCLAPQTMACEK